MQETRVYDYMIRSGIVECSYAGTNVSIPVSIGVTPRLKHGEIAANCILSAEKGGLRIIVVLDNDTGLPVLIDRISLETTVSLPVQTPFFCNGYQSSSASGMVTIDRTPRSPGLMCSRLFRSSGDYDFVKYSSQNTHSWTYTYFDGPLGYTLIASLDETKAYTKFVFTDIEGRKGVGVSIDKDCEGLVYGPVSRISGVKQEPLKVLDVFMSTGNENKCWNSYFSLFYSLRKSDGLYNRSRPALAWDSSYAMLDSMSDIKLSSIISEYSKSSIPLDYFLIGYGYEAKFGDWMQTCDDFPSGMKRIADACKAAGYKPGITFSPFVCSSSSLLFHERREILLKDARGRLVSAGYSRNLGGKLYVIDLYNPEGERYVKRCLRTFIKDWGMQIVRADMLYAAALNSGPATGRTRAQAMSYAMDILRKYTGDIPLIACGVPLGSVFGLVEFCSIAPDLSQSWSGKTNCRCTKHLRERESTENAIRTAIARRHLDLHAFSSDIGSFTLRRYRGRLLIPEQLTLFKACNIFSSLITGSDSLGAYNAETLERFLTAVSSRPIRRSDKNVLDVAACDEGIKVNYILHGVRCEDDLELISSLELNPRSDH